jgi:enolase
VLLDGAKLLNIPEEALETFLSTTPYNAVKLQLNSLSSITSAIDICKRAYAVNIAVQIASADRVRYPESTDSFLADFAVGVAAGQLCGGGLESGEFLAKYNRISDIILENGANVTYQGRNFR